MDEVSREEMDEIAALLQEYTLPAPERKRIDETVSCLTEYMRRQNICKAPSSMPGRILSLLKHIMSYSGKWYALACFMIYSAALLLIMPEGQMNPYAPVIVLAPVPAMLALLDAFRSREAGMAELETSLRYNVRQLMMAKLALAALTSVFFNSVLSVAITFTFEGINMARLFFFWCVPFLLISSVALYITMKIRGSYTSAACLSIWSVLSVFITGKSSVMEFLISALPIEILFVSSIISLALLIYEVYSLLGKAIERGDLFDSDSGKSFETI